MTQQHTEGRLEIERIQAKYTYQEYLRLYVGECVVAEVGGGTPDFQEVRMRKNAERLASAWNAFSGVDGDPETLLANLLEAAETLAEKYIENSDRGLPYISGPQKSHSEDAVVANLRAALSPFAGKKETPIP